MPEQQKNLSAIVWLYRGRADRFAALIAETPWSAWSKRRARQSIEPLNSSCGGTLAEATIAKHMRDAGLHNESGGRPSRSSRQAEAMFGDDVDGFQAKVEKVSKAWKLSSRGQ